MTFLHATCPNAPAEPAQVTSRGTFQRPAFTPARNRTGNTGGAQTLDFCADRPGGTDPQPRRADQHAAPAGSTGQFGDGKHPHDDEPALPNNVPLSTLREAQPDTRLASLLIKCNLLDSK